MDKQRAVIAFAQEELERYLALLGVRAEIRLGLLEDFGLDDPVADPFWDDAYAIRVTGQKGYAAGSNGRSVLFAVYRLLEEWGIGWVRPGANGTYIPKTSAAPDLDIFEVAAKRHRTMCIEGAVSLENVLDMIEWIPKRGFNGYYIQFNDAFIFFDRWYSHRGNPLKQPEPISYDQALENVGIMIREIKKRGLLLQRMGHGWTCDPFGVPNRGWDPVDPETIPQSYKDLCALVNGERQVWKNMPIATQLCYSNPKVANTIAKGILDYIEQNPDTDVIHFWLGDYFNNTCECPECTKLHFSDYAVRIMNLVTNELEARGLKKCISFSCGYNTGWPPKDTQISHPENLLLTFAPIARTFGETFPEGFRKTEILPYAVNDFRLPRSVEDNLAFLYQWEQYYKGDTADFDYHLMWDHILDAGGECIARVLHEDIRNFASLGMNGFISCQLQRNAFPTSVAMTVMGKTLWNNDTDFDQTRRDLYGAAFGEEAAERLCDYFAVLSRGFDIGALRSQKPVEREQLTADMTAAVAAMEEMEGYIAAALSAETDGCRRESWELLELHRQIYGDLGRSVLAYLAGDKERSRELQEQSVAAAWANEDKLQKVLDCMFYADMTRSRINLDGPIAFSDF